MMKKLLFLTLALMATVTANAQNPYLPLWEHVPDGEPRVFEDPDNPGKLRAYIIGSHDVNYSNYCGPDRHTYSRRYSPARPSVGWVHCGDEAERAGCQSSSPAAGHCRFPCGRLPWRT